jgi:hypothetical protein
MIFILAFLPFFMLYLPVGTLFFNRKNKKGAIQIAPCLKRKNLC